MAWPPTSGCGTGQRMLSRLPSTSRTALVLTCQRVAVAPLQLPYQHSGYPRKNAADFWNPHERVVATWCICLAASPQFQHDQVSTKSHRPTSSTRHAGVSKYSPRHQKQFFPITRSRNHYRRLRNFRLAGEIPVSTMPLGLPYGRGSIHLPVPTATPAIP